MKAWVVWSIVSLLAYGGSSFCMKVAADRLGWRLACGIGMGLEALLILAFVASGVGTGGHAPADGRPLGIAAAVGIGVLSAAGFTTFMLGCTGGPVSLVQGMVSAGTLVILALLAWAFLGEKLSPLQWLGVILGLGSIAFLAWGGKS